MTHHKAHAAWRHDEAVVNGVRLHYVEAGSGPLVVLLHGFPEFWYSWRSQIEALSEAGHRVAAPDLRGYNLSDKPADGYDVPNLVEDIAGFIRALGAESAVVCGHDWGGGLTWAFASEVLTTLPDEALRAAVADTLRHRIAGAETVEEAQR